jgi:hypothetical protein
VYLMAFYQLSRNLNHIGINPIDKALEQGIFKS